MKIATYNVHGVNGRLPMLLKWLAAAKPVSSAYKNSRRPTRSSQQQLYGMRVIA
jgi:hypothetical protein